MEESRRKPVALSTGDLEQGPKATEDIAADQDPYAGSDQGTVLSFHQVGEDASDKDE